MSHNNRQSFEPGEAIAKRLIVKLAAGKKVVKAGATDTGVGVTPDTAYAVGDPNRIAVEMLTPGNIYKATTAGAYADNAQLYQAANGTIDDAVGGGNTKIGFAIEASGGAGEVREFVCRF